VVDTLTGQTAAFAILAALLRRQRGGGGEYIDVAMLDASLAFMTSAVVPWLVTGRQLEKTGNVGYSGQPTSALYPAADGQVLSLGVVQQHQFVQLAKTLGREDWLQDERFADPDSRRQHSLAMQEELGAVLMQAPAAEWELRLSRAGLPCGVVRDVAAAASMPHLAERQALLPLHIPGLPEREDVHIVNAGFRMQNDGPQVTQAPPRLGEHAQEILEWLGYAPAEIDTLLQGGSNGH
jgi:CoA:oxalate CoA-transferase